MAFVDELNIHVRAGKGGDGVVRWRHEKYREFGGPSGGDGGNGGDVYVRAVRDVHLLSNYRHKKKFRAENGDDGAKDSLHGKNGDDLIIDLPVGSVITNLTTKKEIRLDEEGQQELLLKGGRGGRGNESFKSSTNTTPKESTPGKLGEEADFHIEVELIADIGLVGLPSAGKTSLLNELTNAQGKVGAYPFTTLEPNLGEYFGYIVADIPGLIEGAADGKGLGHAFLRHIRRTKMLVHLVSLENEDVVETYRTIRRELETYDQTLKDKKEIVLLTKTDVLEDHSQVQKHIDALKKENTHVFALSLYDDARVKEIRDMLLEEVKNL